MNRIEMIHQDFDTAVETLVKIADNKQESANAITAPKPQNDYEDGKWLESIGFSNTEKAIKAKEFDLGRGKIINVKTANESEAKSIKSVVDRYRQMYPFHKFILYSQVVNICEKYNLVFSPSDLYKGDIPTKNVKELKNFDFKTYHANARYKPEISFAKPVCAQDVREDRYNSQSYLKMYICAPLKDFITKDSLQIGKELYHCDDNDYKINPLTFKVKHELMPAPKDPIILLPVLAQELYQIGFIVVTKWGLEANDPELQVGITN